MTATARGMPTAAHSSHSAAVAASMPSDGGDHEERGVGGPQAGAQLADEVGVAGGVQQVDLDAVVQQRRAGQATERCWRTAAGSWSLTVVPSATVPARPIVPVAASSASTSVVLPAPECPTSTTLRTLPGSVTTGARAGDTLLLGLLRHGAHLPQPVVVATAARREAARASARRYPPVVCCTAGTGRADG